MATFISLAISDTMFHEGTFKKECFTAQEAQEWLEMNWRSAISVVNPSHTATIDVLNRKCGIDLPVPEKAPQIVLQPGDIMMVFQATLPRLKEGEVHSDETVEIALFTFSLWTICH